VKQAQKLNIIKISSDEQQLPIINKEEYHKVYYIRYADDFLIGVRGSKEFAIDIRKEVIQFLQADLHLSVNQVNLIHATENKVRFVGFDIKIPKKEEASVLRLKKSIAFSKLRNRIKMRKSILENR
jgi:hypothetical protein